MKITIKRIPKIMFEEAYGGDIINYQDVLYLTLSSNVIDKDNAYKYNAVNLTNGDLELIPLEALVDKVVESELIVKL